MRLGTLRVVTVVLSLLGATTFAAQQPPSSTGPAVPRLVRVTGTFVPANHMPPAPVEALTLTIYADETGRTPLWQETQYVAVDANGLYTVLLGATLPEGLPLDLFASGDARWLGRRFERSGEGEQPRVLLTSVPYALKASDADTLGGRPPSAYRLVAPAAGDGEGSASADAAGDATTPSGSVVPALSAGTLNFVGKFVNGTDLGNSAMYDAGGRVGVNTTTPFDFLHTRFTDTSGVFTGYAVQNLGSGAASYSGMLFYDQTGALGQFQGFNNSTHEYRINNIATGGSINFMIGYNSKFLVANSGNIGLGVPTPASKLDVAGDINLTGMLKYEGSTVLRASGFSFNTAIGDGALASNLPQNENNTAVGRLALNLTNTTGGVTGASNTGIGSEALRNNTTGAGNIAIGVQAGLNVSPDGSNNILIGSAGAFADSGSIRIGRSGSQTSFFAVGVRAVTTGNNDAVPVVIDSNGQLGTVNSSRRYKEDIQDMGEASSGLMNLRPVTYRYRQPYANGAKPIDYGLIAEEVEAVYPDLVTHLADGEVETVQYQKINAMLLNEVQKQHRTIEDLEARLATLERLLATDTK